MLSWFVLTVAVQSYCEYKIPRILHQTFYERPVSIIINASITKLRSQNPEYEYRFYDDHDALALLKTHEQQLPLHTVDTFRRILPNVGSIKADLFRYAVLYLKGGVYLDLDSSLNMRLRDVIDTCASFMCIENIILKKYNGCVHQLLATAPQSRIMWEALRSSINNLRACFYGHHGAWFGTLESTGPILLSHVYQRYQHQEPFIRRIDTKYKNIIWKERAISSQMLYGTNYSLRYYYTGKQKTHLYNHSGQFCFLDWDRYFL